MIPPSRNLDGNRPVDLLYESLVEALKATAGGSAALNRPLSQSPTATPSSRAPTVKNLSFQESSAPVHAARRRGCTELLTLGCQKFCAPSGIFFNGRLHQTAATTAGFRSAICQSTARELRKPARPAVDCGRLPWHLKYDRLLRRACRFFGGVRSAVNHSDKWRRFSSAKCHPGRPWWILHRAGRAHVQRGVAAGGGRVCHTEPRARGLPASQIAHR